MKTLFFLANLTYPKMLAVRSKTGFATRLLPLLLLAVVCRPAGATPIDGLYNTGVDDQGNVLPLFTLEQHYTVSGAATRSYLSTIVFHNDGSGQAWVTPPSGAAWIGPSATGSTWPVDPPGTYYYGLAFTVHLTAAQVLSAVITGDWASDNSGQIWLNGQYTGFNKGEWGFSQLDHFSLSSGFIDGDNIIEFRVNNSSGPSGLLVANLQGAYTTPAKPPPLHVPESAATLPLLLTALVGIAYSCRSRPC